jgi:two-component system nitrate/nitrite sensor histidine kinase NarX
LTTVAITVAIAWVLEAINLERQYRADQATEERLQAQKEALEAQRLTCAEIREWSQSMTHMVQTISSAISEPLELGEIMEVVLCEMVRMAGLQKGLAMLLDEEKQELYLVAHTGVPDWFHQALTRVRVGDGLAGWCAEKGEVLIVDDILHDPRPFVPGTIDVVRFYAGIPLKAGGKVLGVMNLAHGEEHSLTPEQIALLSAAGQQLGVAIEAARLNAQLRSMATLEERTRLSRELHDSLLQVLAYLHLKSQIAQRLLAQNRLVETLDELREVEKASSQAYDDVRDSIAGLRVTLSAGRSFLEAIQEHARLFQERNLIPVTLDDATWLAASLPRETEIQLLRIVQEAMANVRRHAQASRVWLTLVWQGDMASIAVRDNGIGFDPVRIEDQGHQHLGLQTMKERAESVGARLQIASSEGQGTEILVELPLVRSVKG